jgi:hypothetical protein
VALGSSRADEASCTSISLRYGEGILVSAGTRDERLRADVEVIHHGAQDQCRSGALSAEQPFEQVTE